MLNHNRINKTERVNSNCARNYFNVQKISKNTIIGEICKTVIITKVISKIDLIGSLYLGGGGRILEENGDEHLA